MKDTELKRSQVFDVMLFRSRKGFILILQIYVTRQM